MKIDKQFILTWIHPPTAWICLFLFLLALIPRLDWALQTHPALFSDMEDYVMSAAEFARGGYLAQSEDRLAYRPPLYPTLIALFFWIFPSDFITATRIFQAILSSITSLFIYGCAHILTKCFKPSRLPERVRTGIPIAAGVVYALSGSSIFFAGVLMTESVYLLLFTCWLWLGLLAQERKTYTLLILYSMLLGFMALVRPISLFFIPVVIAVVLSNLPREKWKTHLWLPGVAWLLPILPWTIRNFMVFGAFVLISTNSGVNLFIGQHPNYSYWHTGGKEIVRERVQQELGPDEVAEDRVFLRTALSSLSQDPMGFFPRAGLKLYYLYWLELEPWPWAEYPMLKNVFGLPLDSVPFFWWSPVWIPLVLAGIFYTTLYKARHSTLISVLLLYTAACCIYFARTRFRMPIEPILIIYAVFGLASIIEMGIRLYTSFRQSSTKKLEQ